MAKTPKKSTAIPRTVRMELLEARVLYSAEAAPLLALVDPDAQTSNSDHTADLNVWDALNPKVSTSKITELVLVDNSQPDIQTLLELISSSQSDNKHIAIVTLDSNSSAIDSISDVLNRFNDLNAIHVVSHASDGELRIDGESITLSTLQSNVLAVQQWGESLTNDGDILLYGCNLSATTEGHAFARSLSTLTGADVASSSDVTGHALKNGNWDLEVTEGVIETDSAITQSVQNDWTGSLDITAGLVHHYEFQNNGADSVGSAPATLFNDITFDQGQVRLAAQFDTDPVAFGLQYAEINSADLTNFGTDYFSVAMWIKTTDTGNENVLMSNMNTSTNGFKIFTDNSGEINIEYVDGSVRDLNSSISVADGNWYHVVATRGFEGIYLRITDANGVLVDDEYNYGFQVATLNVDSSDNLGIGSAPGDNTKDFDGEIDDIRFYDRDLSLEEIAEIAALGTAPQQQSVLHNEITLANNTTTAITSDDLLTVDKESSGTDLTYELTSDLPDGLTLTLNSIALNLGDNFTQADVNAGLIAVVTDVTPTSNAAQTIDYTINFEVSDPSGPASSDVFQIAVNVEANTPPTIELVDVPQPISEATAVGTIVGSVSVSDVDGQTITSSVATPSDEYFSIDASNNIVLIKSIDFETTNSIDLIITASDGYAESSQTNTIAIGDENDAPASGEGILTSIDEDTADPQGQTIEDLYGSSFIDADTGDTLAGIAISDDWTISSSEGQYEYSTDRVNWQAIGDVAPNNALVLSSSTYIRFVPVSNYYGLPDNVWVNVIDSNYNLGHSSNTDKVYIDVSNATQFGYVDPVGTLLETSILPVNDSPQVPAASLPSIQEDSGNSSGTTIASIYEPIFSDLDANTDVLSYYGYYVYGNVTGDTFAGLVVTRNLIDADQGSWEYSTDNTNWNAIGTVSESQALVLSSNSSIRFLPATDFSGTPNNLSVRALDNSWTGGFTDGTSRVEIDSLTRPSDSPMSFGNPPLNIEVINVNDAPVANDDVINVNEGGSVSIDLYANDSDVENDSLSFFTIDSPSNGSTTFLGGGNINYQHDGSESTTDTFTYSLSDGTDSSNQATVTINITPINDAPVIDSVTLPNAISESTATGTVIGSVVVSDAENNPYTLTIDSPGDTYVQINSSDEIVLIGALDFETNTNLNFTVRVTDDDGQSDTYLASIAIEDANEAPSISAATLSPVDEDTFPEGQTIASLFAGSFFDTDANSSLVGVAIDSNAGGTTNGFWHYKTEEPFWHQVYSPTENGALVLRADDVVRFSPAANYNGTPTPLTLHALDDGYTGNFTEDANRVLLNVANPEEFGAVSLTGVDLNAIITPVNDLPEAVDDIFNTTEDADLNDNVISNDTDIENDPITATLVSTTSDGNLSFNPDGSFTYTHNEGPASTDSFTYQISDGSADSNIATATINITTSNDDPSINSVNSTQAFSESTPVGTIIATVNVSDIDNDDVTLSIQSPEDVFLTIDASNNIRVVSAVDYETQASIDFDISAEDGNGGFDTASFTVPIVDENEAPSVTSAILSSVNEDDLNPPGELISSLFDSSFTDVDANSSLSGVAIDSNTTPSSEGVWQYSSDSGAQWYDIANRTTASALLLSENTLVRFIPAANFNGTPTPISLHALDNGYGGAFTSGASTITLNTDNTNEFGFISVSGVQLTTDVLSVNDVPSATTDNYTLNEGENISDNVLANDSDVEASTLSAAVITFPQHGALSFAANGNFTYNHNGSTATTDNFSYEVSDGVSTSIGEVYFTISGINDAPVFDMVSLVPAINESDNAGLVIGSITVSDEENDSIALSLDTPTDSYFTVNTANEIVLSATIDYETITSVPINITATDSNGASSSYNAFVPIQDLNEAPTIASANLNAVSEDDNDPAGETVSSLFISSFSDVDAASSLSGIAISDNTTTSDGTWQYSIDGDNWVDIGPVSETNALAIAQSSVIRFLASADFNGMPPNLGVRALDNEFTGGFTDGVNKIYTDVSNAQSFGSVSVIDKQLTTMVSAENDLPAAEDDNFNTTEDADLIGNVITNDYDADGDMVIATLTSTTSNGTLSFSDNGSFTYTHNQGPATSDSFTYQLTDGSGDSNIATVNIVIATENDAPIIDSIPLRPEINESLAIGSVIGTVNATDIDGDTLSFSISSPEDSFLTINESNQIVTTSALDFETQPSITFVVTASDENGGIDTANVTLNIDNVNEAPSLSNSTLASIDEDNENPAGASIASLFSNSFVDVDNNAELSGIAISSNTAGNEGEWQYSNDGVMWSDIGSVTPTSALVIESTTLLRFLPTENYHGVPTALSMYALDENYSGGFSNVTAVYIDASAIEYSGTIALQAVTLSTEIASVNDIPFLTSPTGPLSVPENTSSGTIVGVIQASDNDHTELNYSLINDADGKFDIDENTGTITVANDAQLDFEADDSHTITIRVMDEENDFSDTDVVISVTPANEPPLLDSIETNSLEFIENDSAKAISTTITVSEPDNGFIESAQISFLSGFNTEQDTLIFQDSADITGQFNSSNGVLTLSGTSQAGSYQDAIRSVLYLNTSENPSTTPRILSISVNDDANPSNTMEREIDVVSVNDDESLTANMGASIDPNGSVFITSEMLNVTDVDNDPSSIVYSKSAVWSSILLMVNGAPAETFTQQDVNRGMVEIVSMEELGESTVLPLFVNDEMGQPLSFEMIISTNQPEPEPEPEQPSAALEAAPIEFILEEILNEVVLTPSSQTSFTSSEQTETQPSTGSEAQETTLNATQASSSDALEQSLSINIPEQFEIAATLDMTVLANELSEPEKVTKKHKPLGAKAAVDLQIASLLSLEPLSIEHSNAFKLAHSDNMLTRSIENMQEQLARTAEKYQNNSSVQDTIAGVTISITAGFLIWAIRGGALLASMLSISPLWKQLDPLAIMNSIKGDTEDAKREEDEEVEDLFTKQ